MVSGGDRVLYVPKWVHHKDTEHPECERGTVVRTTRDRYDVIFSGVKTPQGCDPADLRPLS